MKRIHQIAKRVLPEMVRKRLVSWSNKLHPEAFALLAHEAYMAPNMQLGLLRLAARGLQPKSVLDVGAFHGDWSTTAHEIWPNAQISMVEANLDKRPILTNVAQKIGAELHFALLGPKDDEDVTFYVMESGSSVYSENSPLDRREEPRVSQRLDSVIEHEAVDFIKLDVQGFELEVLKGATQLLPAAQAVLVEVSLIEINEGAPLLSDVVKFMDEQGFGVCDILEIHRRPLDRATNQVDLLFAPKTSPLFADTRHF